MSIERDELHRLIDQLPESEVMPAFRYLRYLKDLGEDPMLKKLAESPVDDEPESDEESEGAHHARQEARQGRLFTDDDLERELGL